MPSITIKNVPEPLHAELKAMAKRHHRSLNDEVIACLDARYGQPVRDVTEALSEARAIRRRTAGCGMTPGAMEEAIEQGRA